MNRTTNISQTLPHIVTGKQYAQIQNKTSGSAMAEGPRDALVSRNSATTKHPTRQATCAF